jgi:hypothetical protein
MLNLVNYVANHHSNIELEIQQLSKEHTQLATKINTFFTETKPQHRQDVLDYFGISKHMFYKLKQAKAIQVPDYITNKKIRVKKK